MQRFDAKKATDTQLLIRFQDGRDQRAFAELVRRYGQMVMATSRRVLGNEEDAQDVFQATFLALAMVGQQLRTKAAVGGWLQRTAYQCAVTLQRKNISRERLTERLMDRESVAASKNIEPMSAIANDELSEILDEELARLPVKLNAAIILCDLEGLTQKEAANRMGIATSTVNDHVAKGRKILRAQLVQRGLTLGLGGLAAVEAASRETTAAMSDSLVADITAKATLYAAGKSASEAGISSAVVELATGISKAMTKAKLISVFLTALALLAFGSSLAGLVGVHLNTASAGTLFVDDFSDGDYADGSPVTWKPVLTPASFDASTGKFVIGRTNDTAAESEPSADARDVVIRDVSVRARVKVTETNGGAGISTRNQDSNDTLGYFAGIAYQPEFGGSLVSAGISLSGNQQEFFLTNDDSAIINLPYDVRKEFTDVQLDVFEDQIDVWAWRAGDPMPDQPQFSISDTTYTDAGYIRLLSLRAIKEQGGSSSAIFESVHVADMPIHNIPSTKVGDFDRSGVLDVADIDRLNSQIQLGIDHPTFDLDGDGVVTESDREVWVRDLAKTFLGDANLDSRVDAADLNSVALNWRQAVASWAGGDFTGDGFVDAADLNVVALNWRKASSPSTAVPEPSSLVLFSVFFGSSFFLVRRAD